MSGDEEKGANDWQANRVDGTTLSGKSEKDVRHQLGNSNPQRIEGTTLSGEEVKRTRDWQVTRVERTTLSGKGEKLRMMSLSRRRTKKE